MPPRAQSFQSQRPSKQRISYNRKHPARRPNFAERKENEGFSRPKLKDQSSQAYQIKEKSKNLVVKGVPTEFTDDEIKQIFDYNKTPARQG